MAAVSKTVKPFLTGVRLEAFTRPAWGSAGGGECDVQNPDFGNCSQGLGLKVRHSVQGDSCAQQL